MSWDLVLRLLISVLDSNTSLVRFTADDARLFFQMGASRRVRYGVFYVPIKRKFMRSRFGLVDTAQLHRTTAKTSRWLRRLAWYWEVVICYSVIHHFIFHHPDNLTKLKEKASLAMYSESATPFEIYCHQSAIQRWEVPPVSSGVHVEDQSDIIPCRFCRRRSSTFV